MKLIEKHLNQMRALLVESNSHLLKNFDELLSKKTEKEIIMWLADSYNKKELPQESGKIIAIMFDMLH